MGPLTTKTRDGPVKGSGNPFDHSKSKSNPTKENNQGEKQSFMKRKSLITAVGILGCAAVMATTAQAGGKAVVPMAPPAEMPLDNLLDPIETTLSSGYMSDYNFRGGNVGRHAIWTGLNFALPLGLPVGNYVANFGAWYINPTDSALGVGGRGALDDELDWYASLGTTVGAFDVSVGWTHYSYPDSSGASGNGTSPALEIGDQDEVGINIGTSIGPIDIGAAYYYNFDIADNNYLAAVNGPGGGNSSNQLGDLQHYLELTVGHTMELTDRLGLSIGSAAGWYSDEFAHITTTLSFPLQVAENVVFEPYLQYLHEDASGDVDDFYLSGTDDGGDLSAGVSLSVSF